MPHWAEFTLALTLFFASHAIPARPAIKGRLVTMLGRRGYGIAFGLLSLAILVWLVSAANRAPFVPLWDQQIWQRWLVNLAMPLAILLASFGVAAPNPFSFDGRSNGFDPDHPGIAGVTRHPLLMAMLIWSTLHLLVNGDLTHVILFGLFAGFSAIGIRAIERRNQRNWGQAEWERLTAQTAVLPFAAFLSGRWKPRHRPSLLRLGIAVLIWVTLLHLHEPVIGVTPLP